MPLSPGSSRQVVSSNIREMMHSGYPQKQAVAASLSNARRHPGRAEGGDVGTGAGALPMPEYILALQRLQAARRAALSNPPPPKQEAQAKAEGGIIDHDDDKDLPRAQDHARLVPVMGGDSAQPPPPPGYLEHLMRMLIANQKRLGLPSRPVFWRGGFVGWH